MRSPRWLAALLALLTLVATACASEADDDPVAEPPIDATPEEPADGPVAGPNGSVPDEIEWEECGATACGVLDGQRDYEQDWTTVGEGKSRSRRVDRAGRLISTKKRTYTNKQTSEKITQ